MEDGTFDVFDFISAIPEIKDRGVDHTATCPCGGTIHAIRSTVNGHLNAMCDKCGFFVIE